MKKVCSLVIILVIFHLAASAQFNQGSIYFDGTVNYNNDNVNVATLMVGAPTATKSNNLIVSPGIGYFVANNFAIGVGLEYKSLSSSNTTLTESVFDSGVLQRQTYDLTSSKWKELAPSLFVKYVFPVSDKLSFSIMAKFAHGLLTDEMSVNSTSITFDPQKNEIGRTVADVITEKPSKQTNRFNIAPEFQYLITNKFGLKVNFTGFTYNSVPVINHSYETVDGTRFNNVVNYGTQKTTSFNVNPSSWSFGVFVLLGGKNSESKGSETKESK